MCVQFCVKLAACFLLFMTHGVQWLYAELLCTWYVGIESARSIDAQELFAMMEALVWGMASVILWMEYRRSMTPSPYLRMFWMVKWIAAIYVMIVYQSFSSVKPSSTTMVVVGGVRFVTKTILALFCFFTPTPITVDLVSFPQEVPTPSALLHSQNFQRQYTNVATYDSFCDYDWVCAIRMVITMTSSLSA